MNREVHVRFGESVAVKSAALLDTSQKNRGEVRHDKEKCDSIFCESNVSIVVGINKVHLRTNLAGTLNPRQAVLATCAKEAIPHARVVAIREINERGLLFFTQKGTRKFNELISLF